MATPYFLTDPKCGLSLIDIVDTAGDSKSDFVKCSASKILFNGGIFLAVIVLIVIILMVAGGRGALPIALIIGVIGLTVVSLGVLSSRWAAGREYDIAREELKAHLSTGASMGEAKEKMREERHRRDLRTQGWQQSPPRGTGRPRVQINLGG